MITAAVKASPAPTVSTMTGAAAGRVDTMPSATSTEPAAARVSAASLRPYRSAICRTAATASFSAIPQAAATTGSSSSLSFSTVASVSESRMSSGE